jgi:hypothetical protein
MTTAAVAALWLPLALVLAATGWWLTALAVALWPALLLSPWYGIARAPLAPFAVYAILPILANALIGVLSTTHVPWKGREV